MANIIEVATTAGTFTTLLSALQAADLTATLSGPGPFTVFAPTDAAFHKLHKGPLDSLLKDVPKLKHILTYHVVPQRLMAEDLARDLFVETLEGAKLTIAGSVEVVDVKDIEANADDDSVEETHKETTYTKITVNGIGVAQTNVIADNGVIHVIDGVLMPK